MLNIELILLFQFLEDFWGFFLFIPVKIQLQIVTSSYPRDHNLNKLKCTLPEWVSRRSGNCKKFTDGQTDERQTKNDQESSFELSALVS